ncbi:hypothetical protein D9611_002725 [Ephemerocybe angulata]|uniref:F-box domain-containing protein n=1 Tax=Ephemerocybe angulata TaxID=980116 RepID=A0A8H5C1L9_9AGAR|nr:hypothetical protein D9611_002725 [Tulosesus angulatus]
MLEGIKHGFEDLDAATYDQKEARRIAGLEEETRLFNIRRNASTLTCRLPVEVLAKIFMIHSNESLEPSDPDDGLYWGDFVWIRVTHVCRHWREVALACIPLWTNLSTGFLKSTNIAEVLFQRSRAAPIELNNFTWDPEHPDLLQRIVSQPSRLRSLCLESYKDGYVNRPTRFKFKSLFANYTDAAPILERLILKAYARDFVPQGFLSGGAPSLTHLTLFDTKLAWGDLPLAAGLTHLHLEDGDNGRFLQRPTFQEFTDALKQLPSLQYLILMGYLPLDTPHSLPRSPPSPPVHLPLLQVLKLADFSDKIADVLGVVRVPAVCAVCFRYRGDDFEASGNVARALENLNIAFDHETEVDDTPSKHRPLQAVPILELMHGGICRIHLSREPECVLDILPTNTHFWISFEWHNILKQHFDLTPLVDLEVSESNSLSRETWKQIFAPLPNLQKISVEGTVEDFLTFIYVLQDDSDLEAIPLPQDNQESSGSGCIPNSHFPALTDVTFCHATKDDDDEVPLSVIDTLIHGLKRWSSRSSGQTSKICFEIKGGAYFVEEDIALLRKSLLDVAVSWDSEWKPFEVPPDFIAAQLNELSDDSGTDWTDTEDDSD